MAQDEDDIVVPKKSKPARAALVPSSGKGASLQMLRLMRVTSSIGIALGGFVTLVSVMGVVGLLTDNMWARLVIGLIVVVGLPAFLADRILKRSSSTLATRAGIGTVTDVFAIVLLGAALMLVAADTFTKGLLAREGDRYARVGSTAMARAVYFVAGVSPVFPSEKAAAPGGASASASAKPPVAPK